jgi:hypothetical protein
MGSSAGNVNSLLRMAESSFSNDKQIAQGFLRADFGRILLRNIAHAPSDSGMFAAMQSTRFPAIQTERNRHGLFF